MGGGRISLKIQYIAVGLEQLLLLGNWDLPLASPPWEVSMADRKIVETHPAWEDWLGAGLGFLIALTPSLVSETVDKGIQLNTALIGILVLLVAFFERVRLHHWEEVAEIVLGAWLIALPFIHGYAGEGALRYWHFALGGIVVLLALHELWQDWGASREDLASHGW